MFHTVAFSCQFDDDRMVNETVNRGSGGHRILEDAVPLSDDQIAGDHQASPFVSVRQKREKHLHLVPAPNRTFLVREQNREGRASSLVSFGED